MPFENASPIEQLDLSDFAEKNIYCLSGMLTMKKVIYVLLTIFLCLMLLFILNAFVAMPRWFQYILLIVGTVGGYHLGQYWWRVVYVQHRHWYFRMKDRDKTGNRHENT